MALAVTRSAGAQDIDLANHPMAGAWLVRILDGSVAPSYFHPDGTWSIGTPVIRTRWHDLLHIAAEWGLGTGPGERARCPLRLDSEHLRHDRRLHRHLHHRWLPERQRRRQIQGDDWSKSFITIRDVNDEVVDVIRRRRDNPAIAGVRMTPASSIFPPLHGSAATPES